MGLRGTEANLGGGGGWRISLQVASWQVRGGLNEFKRVSPPFQHNV